MKSMPKRESHPGALFLFRAKLIADGKSMHTVSSYCRDVKAFLVFADEEALTTDLVNAYFSTAALINKTTGNRRDPASVNKIKSSLKAFFKWVFKTRILETDLSVDINLKPVSRKEPNFLSDFEQRRLLKIIRSAKGALAERDQAIVSTLLLTGIRVDALVNLDIDGVNLEDKKLTIRTKGDKHMKIFINSHLRLILKRYLKARRKEATQSDALFLSNRKSRITSRQVAFRLKTWTRQAGITKPISPHSLRHTFATELLKKTQNLRIVQKALGHVYLETTQIYTHILDEEMEDALELL